MKVSLLLPAATLASAFVVPDANIFASLPIEKQRQSPIKASWEDIKDSVTAVKDITAATIDEIFESAESIQHKVETTTSDSLSWGEAKAKDAWNVIDNLKKDHHGPPHHPHEPPPEHDPHHGPPHHGKPHCPGNPHHGGSFDRTVYQLISDSKYTTKLAKLVNDFPDIVQKLNSTGANFTIFAPTDKAFEKIPEHAEKPSKETLEKILSYHIVEDVYSAKRVLKSHTIPTLLKGEHLSDSPRPQRLRIGLDLHGPSINFYSHIIAANIFGTNGVIHGIDSLLVPPPNVIEVIDFLPAEFSTLELALAKTGLLHTLNSTNHPGGTFFAPSNFAFKKLGTKINMFLFSKHGQKYLKALLLYHIGTGTTLYSDAAYVTEKHEDTSGMPFSTLPADFAFLNKKPCHGKLAEYKREARKPFNREDYEKHMNGNAKRQLVVSGGGEHPPPHHDTPHTPKGYHHYDLPTMLEGQKLNVDVVRYGVFVFIKVNGFSLVSVQDLIAQDGVIQVVSDVLVPPHGDRLTTGSSGSKVGRLASIGRIGVRKIKGVFGYEHEMSLCEFKARFRGLVDEE